MKFWVGVTDNEWFNFLSKLSPDEVNFWQPSGNFAFEAIKTGELFLFKLHSPLNYITGGGFFVRYSRIPLSMAWEAFGEKNGVASFEILRAKIMKYRGGYEPDPLIGCIILAQPFFFMQDQWIPIPKDWSSNIVRGKTYNTTDQIGAQLYANVQERLVVNNTSEKIPEQSMLVAEKNALYGSEYLTSARLGQGTFRILVTEAYNRRCAITGERTLPVLEASHIKPFAVSGPNTIENGLLLRSDLHKLFDLGYLTITRDLHIEVSKRIKEKYENGREYYTLHGGKLKIVPLNAEYLPSTEYIEWHNQNIYVA
ncbi:MAG: HNH endonuclease [Patescibacteria group bacterium]